MDEYGLGEALRFEDPEHAAEWKKYLRRIGVRLAEGRGPGEKDLRSAVLPRWAEERLVRETGSGFSVSRIVHTWNILADFVGLHELDRSCVADFGPGQFAFSLLAKNFGANVTCFDKNEPFVSLAPCIGLDIVAVDYYSDALDTFVAEFDGVWLKGSFSAVRPSLYGSFEAFARKITALIKPTGWGYVAPNNNSVKFQREYGGEWEKSMVELIESQRTAMETCGWTAVELDDEKKRRYGMGSRAYDASRYIFHTGFKAG